ncbi:MAG TPA: MlaD family protein [Burkholderiales bacterium]|nr:MlaD family protein [Burkholderiales bacterium]
MPEQSEQRNKFSLLPRNLGVKVGMLLAFTITVAVSLVIYVLSARGVFEQTQRLTLIADNVDGVSAGMDLTFAGFPVGRVRRLSLSDDGKGRIHVRVPVEDTRWLRSTTVFVLEVGLVGGAKLRAYTANLQDPPLPDNAVRPVLRGDTAQEIPKMVASLRSVLENIDQMTEASSSLAQSINNARAVTERMAGKYGVLGGVLGSEENAKKIIAAIEQANKALARLEGVLANADQQLFSQDGIASETKKAVAQANAILGDVRESLKRFDAILADMQVTASNTKAATTDLGALRAEVEASLRKVGALIDEINRKWPFARDTNVKLP